MSIADDVANALSSANVLLRAEPGAGKSTGLPLHLLLCGQIKGGILLLEPRRLAARSVAQRLAGHLGERVGGRVGLRMRSDTRVSNDTQLTVVTEGVLTRLLQQDPSLENFGLVIFDEFHERSLHADFGLALCMEVQQALRPDLRLLLMSATLDSGQLGKQLQDVKQFHCNVRQHPVDIIWTGEQTTPIEQRIVKVALTAIEDHEGDVLIFLPGIAEINRTARLLQPRLNNTINLHQLHSGISSAEQAKACAPATAGSRRIILATSLAETSITIDGVCVVIDSGLERRGKIDNSTGAQRLETVMSSQASATQRAGRAGRTTAGVCYRLWSESGHSRRPAHWQPEIFRADLTPLMLDLALWGAIGKNDLPWLDAPPAANLSKAEDLLRQLGLWQNGHISQLGRAVANLPVHPRIGNMLLWASDKGCAKLACRIAVLLEEQLRGSHSLDFGTLLTQPLSAPLRHRAMQLENTLNIQPSANTPPSAAVLLAQAYPDWIAKRRPGKAASFLLSCGAGVIVDGESPIAYKSWLSVAQLGGAGQHARVFKALELDIEELKQFSPEFFNQNLYLEWDNKQERVLAEQRVEIGKLTVDTKPIQKISNHDKAKALLIGIRLKGISCLPWTSECREWQARVTRMGDLNLPNNISQWPSVDDHTLLKQLEDWLLPWLDGMSSIKALQQLDLYKTLNSILDYPQQTLMNQWLPITYVVPSGSKIRLNYLKDGDPILSVRLQEMLGCVRNPTIANEQINLVVELLSPAHRPVQVTSDLTNFWSNSYPAVKKDLAGRYPKHPWPDDPLSAEPTAYAKRHKR